MLRQRSASPLELVSMPSPGTAGYGQDSLQPFPRAKLGRLEGQHRDPPHPVRVAGTFSLKLAPSIGQGYGCRMDGRTGQN